MNEILVQRFATEKMRTVPLDRPHILTSVLMEKMCLSGSGSNSKVLTGPVLNLEHTHQQAYGARKKNLLQPSK